MTYLDTHVHVWDPSRLRYPWLDDFPALDRPFLPSSFPPPSPAAVFIEADCAPAQSLAEARWAAGLKWPALAGIVAAVDLRSDDLPQRLEALSETGRVVGVRHLLQDEDAATWRDPALLRGLRLVAEAGLTFDACVRFSQLHALQVLLRGVPELPVVLDHLGKPPVDAGPDVIDGLAWAEGLRRFAELPGAHVKVSGLAAESSVPAVYDEHADAFITFALEVFGPGRAMLGSDWPVSSTLGAAESPQQWSERVRRIAGDAAAWAKISVGVGSRFYGIDVA